MQRRSSETGKRNFRSKRFSRNLGSERDSSSLKMQQFGDNLQQQQQSQSSSDSFGGARRKTTGLKTGYKIVSINDLLYLFFHLLLLLDQGNSESSTSEDASARPLANKMKVDGPGGIGSYLSRYTCHNPRCTADMAPKTKLISYLGKSLEATTALA